MWTRRNHALLREGGSWAVKRSGLIFAKTATGFELVSVLPYLPELSDAFMAGRDVPASPSQLRDYQREDFRCIQRHHEEAGLTMTDPRGLLT